VPIWMVGVSASVNLPLHHKVQKFSSGTGSPRWSRKKGRKNSRCGGLLLGISSRVLFNIRSMRWRAPDREVDQRGLGERLCRKIVKHVNRTGRMLWIIVDGRSW